MRRFHKLLNTKVADPLPEHCVRAEAVVPAQTTGRCPVIRAWANRKAVRPDGLPAELLKVLADEGEYNTLGKFHDIIIAVWGERGVPHNGKMQRS